MAGLLTVGQQESSVTSRDAFQRHEKGKAGLLGRGVHHWAAAMGACNFRCDKQPEDQPWVSDAAPLKKGWIKLPARSLESARRRWNR